VKTIGSGQEGDKNNSERWLPTGKAGRIFDVAMIEIAVRIWNGVLKTRPRV